jgi:hypothetical protein
MYRILKSTMSAALIFLLMVSFAFPSQAAEPAMNDLGVLFDKVEEMEQSEREALSKELSDLFHAYPFGFIRELNLESTELQDSVRLMLAEYNTSEEGNADYLQFLLSLYPEVREQLQSHELNTYLTILLAFSPDVRNAGDDFTETLFTAMRYADGVGADQCSAVLYLLFQNSPRETLSQLALEDAAFQEMAILQLVYSSWANEGEFKHNMEELSKDETLTPAEQDFLSALAAKVAESEENVPPETTEVTTPTEHVDATEPPVATGGIITAVVMLATVIAAAMVYFGKKKHG